MAKLYAFNQEDGQTLARVAAARRQAPNGATSWGTMVPARRWTNANKSWVLRTTTTLTAATHSTNITPGSGTGIVQEKGATYLQDVTGETYLVRSCWPYAIPTDHLLIAITVSDGEVWATEWLSKPHLFCRFHTSAAFTTSSSSVAGVIDTYFGFGVDHASSSATFNNLAISANYLFEGDSGDYGLAYYTGTGTTWQIVQMECP